MTASEKSDLLFDALLKTAVREAYEKEFGALPDDGALQACAPSSTLDKRIGILIRNDYRKTKARRFIKGLGRAAACFCVILTITSVILLSVGATRNAIFNAIIKRHEQFTEIRFDPLPDNDVIYRPSYLPEGFREFSVKSTVNSTTIIYENESGDQIFFIQQQAENASTLVDNENTDFIETSISGHAGFLFKAKTEQDSSILVWEKAGYVFSLTAAIDSNELIKMGESIN